MVALHHPIWMEQDKTMQTCRVLRTLSGSTTTKTTMMRMMMISVAVVVVLGPLMRSGSVSSFSPPVRWTARHYHRRQQQQQQQQQQQRRYLPTQTALYLRLRRADPESKSSPNSRASSQNDGSSDDGHITVRKRTKRSSIRGDKYPYSLGRFTYRKRDEATATQPDVEQWATTVLEKDHDDGGVQTDNDDTPNTSIDERNRDATVNGETKNDPILAAAAASSSSSSSSWLPTSSNATTLAVNGEMITNAAGMTKKQMDSLINTTLAPLNENAQNLMKAWNTATKWPIPSYDSRFAANSTKASSVQKGKYKVNQDGSVINGQDKGNNSGFLLQTSSSSQPTQESTPGSSSSSSPVSSSIVPPLGKTELDVVTVKDLEEILRRNGYVKMDDLATQPSLNTKGTGASQTSPKGSSIASNYIDRYKSFMDTNGNGARPLVAGTKTEGGRRSNTGTINGSVESGNGSSGDTTVGPAKKGAVAFPQLSIVSDKAVKIGSTATAGVFGSVVATTIVPNLWLMGMLGGGFYGYSVASPASLAANPNPSALTGLILGTGRRLATMFLRVYDFFNGVWFMYKTGQLSYAYYKQFAQMDERFALTDKIDAWNARFQKGKVSFDKWEQENEVGRRILAGLRTVWLVEEQSLKRKQSGNKSRYRVLQYGFNVVAWFGQGVATCWKVVTGGASPETLHVMRGIRMALLDREALGQRAVAAFAVLCIVNVLGALFSVSPTVLGILAIMVGLVWPSWTSELRERLEILRDELEEMGRTNDKTDTAESLSIRSRRSSSSRKTSTADPKSAKSNKATLARPSRRRDVVDKSKYSFYTKEDGTKRWYRTGQSQFSRKPNKKKSNNNKKNQEQQRRILFPWAKNGDGDNDNGTTAPEWGLLPSFRLGN